MADAANEIEVERELKHESVRSVTNFKSIHSILTRSSEVLRGMDEAGSSMQV